MNSHLQKLPGYAPLILRFALAGVFLYFGMSQLTDASIWTGLVPDWALSLSHMTAVSVIHLNAYLEIVASLMLIMGLYVRWVAAVLAVHLFVIAGSLGINPLGIRDFGLSFATLALACFGADRFCLVKDNA